MGENMKILIELTEEQKEDIISGSLLESMERIASSRNVFHMDKKKEKKAQKKMLKAMKRARSWYVVDTGSGK